MSVKLSILKYKSIYNSETILNFLSHGNDCPIGIIWNPWQNKKTFTMGLCGPRSSRSEVFCKKGFLRKFAEFTGEQLCQSLFFNKFAG